MIQREYEQQCIIFKWAEVQAKTIPCVTLLNASLNGVKLLTGQAIKAKKQGMKKGYPDLFLPVARGGYHGLFIELKANYRMGTKQVKGRVSKEQLEWLEKLNNEGYKAVVAYNADGAISIIKEYLGL